MSRYSINGINVNEDVFRALEDNIECAKKILAREIFEELDSHWLGYPFTNNREETIYERYLMLKEKYLHRPQTKPDRTSDASETSLFSRTTELDKTADTNQPALICSKCSRFYGEDYNKIFLCNDCRAADSSQQLQDSVGALKESVPDAIKEAGKRMIPICWCNATLPECSLHPKIKKETGA